MIERKVKSFQNGSQEEELIVREGKGSILDTLTFRCWEDTQVDLALPRILLPQPKTQPHLLLLSHTHILPLASS